MGFIQGAIIKGDYEKFLALYRKSHPFMNIILLNSAGGDVDEAVKIGRLFRKFLLKAKAPDRWPDGQFLLPSYRTSEPATLCRGPECNCASACALIWFGAPDRSGTIGLHRPRFDDPSFRALAPAEAARAYRRMLDGVARYLDEMETPKHLIETMVSTGSGEIRWVDYVSGDRAPSFSEWQAASCGHFTTQDFEMMIELGAKRGFLENSKLSEREELLYKLLSEKDDKKTICEIYLVSSHRERLRLPDGNHCEVGGPLWP
jgi:hypothetical protein